MSAVAGVARRAWPVAECIVLTHYFQPGEAADGRDHVRARHGLGPRDRLIVYTGSFVAPQALDLLLEAFPRVLGTILTWPAAAGLAEKSALR
jgi:hypothetical protein